MSLIKIVGKRMPLPIADAFSMAGKVVIVTGAAGNVGSGIAEVFGANQATVVMTDRAGDKLTHAADYLRNTYPTVTQTPCELTDPAQLKALVDSTVARFGRLDAIVNCGAIPMSTVITEEDVPDFDRLYHTNVRSLWLLTKYAVEPMKAAGGGSIVNIASINGHRALFLCSLYASTKAAVISMSKELAVELAPQNIRVNCVSPGLIPNMNQRFDWLMSSLNEPFASQVRTEFEAKLEASGANSQPLQMIGHGHDIGMACYYLCTPAARFVTGVDIIVDGGKSLEMHEGEPRFYGGQTSIWKAIRLHLMEYPDTAWKEKPKWLLRARAAAAAAASK